MYVALLEEVAADGLTEMSEEVLTDSRLGSNKQHQLVPLLRQSIYSRLAEVAMTRNLFAMILDRIARLPIPPPVIGRIPA